MARLRGGRRRDFNEPCPYRSGARYGSAASRVTVSEDSGYRSGSVGRSLTKITYHISTGGYETSRYVGNEYNRDNDCYVRANSFFLDLGGGKYK